MQAKTALEKKLAKEIAFLAQELENTRTMMAHLQQAANPRTQAERILFAGVGHMRKNAKARDTDYESGERSMVRTVDAFNALDGTSLTEVQGWRFMQCLKMARAATPNAPFNLDDYEDGAAYSGLAGEAAQRAEAGEQHTRQETPAKGIK